jgi:hypothetical protein
VKASDTWSADELLTRARAGESSAFAALVRRYQRTVYSIALRMLSDRHRAEDLAQEGVSCSCIARSTASTPIPISHSGCAKSQ